MNDKDITKLAAKLTQSLATKEDIKGVKEHIKRLERKIDEVDQKASTILTFAEAVDETTEDHEKRLKNIERIPVIAHQLRNNPK